MYALAKLNNLFFLSLSLCPTQRQTKTHQILLLCKHIRKRKQMCFFLFSFMRRRRKNSITMLFPPAGISNVIIGTCFSVSSSSKNAVWLVVEEEEERERETLLDLPPFLSTLQQLFFLSPATTIPTKNYSRGT